MYNRQKYGEETALIRKLTVGTHVRHRFLGTSQISFCNRAAATEVATAVENTASDGNNC